MPVGSADGSGHIDSSPLRSLISNYLKTGPKLPLNNSQLDSTGLYSSTGNGDIRIVLSREDIADIILVKQNSEKDVSPSVAKCFMAADDDLFHIDHNASNKYLDLCLLPSKKLKSVRVDRHACNLHGLQACSHCSTADFITKIQTAIILCDEGILTDVDVPCPHFNMESLSERVSWINQVMKSIRSGDLDGMNNGFYGSAFVALSNKLHNAKNTAHRAVLDESLIRMYETVAPARLQPVNFRHSRSKQMAALAENMHFEAMRSHESEYLVEKLGEKYCQGVIKGEEGRTTDFSSAIKTAWCMIIRLLSCYYTTNAHILMAGDMAMFTLAADYIGSLDETNSKYVSDFCSQSGALAIPTLTAENSYTYAVLGFSFMCMAYNNNSQGKRFDTGHANTDGLITPSEYRRMRQSDVAMHALLTIDWYLRAGGKSTDTDVGSLMCINTCHFSMNCYLTSYRYDDIIDLVSDISCKEMMNEAALVMASDINHLVMYAKATCDSVRLLTRCDKPCAIHLYAVRYEMSCCVYYALNPRFTTLLQVMDIYWNTKQRHYFECGSLGEIYDMKIFVPRSGTLFHNDKWDVQGEVDDFNIDELVSTFLLRACETSPDTQLREKTKVLLLCSSNKALSIQNLLELMWSLFTLVHCVQAMDCHVCSSKALLSALEAVVPVLVPRLYPAISLETIDKEVVYRYNCYVDCITWLTDISDTAALQALNGVTSFFLVETLLSPFKMIAKDVQNIVEST
ncbi:hypothetical protein K7432_009017 [Basidiobolus ranarum]|uniref:Uncharacterized protein n=1 Tax=Basidiobolus ranarum TaxID=34480 RepID=A0ABR2WQW6_9FUNG